MGDKQRVLLPEGAWIGIAGESHYQDALRALTSGVAPGDALVCLADLYPEPDNPYDSHAIAVRIDGHHVGYLSRADAQSWEPSLLALSQRGLQPQVNARIVGGRIHNGSRDMLAVRISGVVPEVVE